MKNINIAKYLNLTLLFGLLFLLACTEEEINPLPNSGTVVDPVTNVEVENINGGAIIMYELPKDKNARYVEAEWTTDKGVVRRAKSSVFTNKIRLEGFPDTQEYEIKLYTVSDAELRSDPVLVKIKPLTPPFIETFASLVIQEDFGGMSVTFENRAEDDIVIIALAKNQETGEWESIHDFYTSLPTGNFTVRGLPAVEDEFGFFVRDRWESYSDTLYVRLTPIYEELLDKSEFKAFDLPGDVGSNYLGGDAMHKLWDDNVNTIMHTYTYNDRQMPGVSFTFDMGEVAKLSRFKFWQRFHDSHNNIFNNANFKQFEIWGTAETPDLDGSWDNWIKIDDIEIKKPSGLPLGQYSNDDLEAVIEGHDFSIPLDTPPVRFLRIKVNENWGGLRWIYASEITFWGSVQK